jgi:P27 family predicted phage terminase small subunit
MATPMRGANGVKSGPSPSSGNLVINTTDEFPDAPHYLGAMGKVRWVQIADILVKRKTWSNDWVPALEHLCREYDNLAFIDQALREPNQFMLVPSTNGRTMKTNPLLDHRLKIEAFIQSQLSAFGLTPASSKGIFTQDPAMSKGKSGVVVRDRSKPMFN